MNATPRFREHNVRRYATDRKIDGLRQTVFCFSCPPCAIYGKAFASKHGRDKAAELHEQGKD